MKLLQVALIIPVELILAKVEFCASDDVVC